LFNAKVSGKFSYKYASEGIAIKTVAPNGKLQDAYE
jgi:hypothetical protein